MCAVPLECAPCVRFQSICAYYPHVNRHQAHHDRGTSSAFSHITRSSRLHSPVAVEMGGLAFLGSAEFSTMAHSLSLSPIRSPDSTTHAIINQTALFACFSLGPPDSLRAMRANAPANAKGVLPLRSVRSVRSVLTELDFLSSASTACITEPPLRLSLRAPNDLAMRAIETLRCIPGARPVASDCRAKRSNSAQHTDAKQAREMERRRRRAHLVDAVYNEVARRRFKEPFKRASPMFLVELVHEQQLDVCAKRVVAGLSEHGAHRLGQILPHVAQERLVVEVEQEVRRRLLGPLRVA